MTGYPILLLATTNPGKLGEITLILADVPFQLRTLADLENMSEVPETGSTFRDNAVLKARGYALQAGVNTIADDSGLEVDALDGAPGVLSARYAGTDASDAERVSVLLTTLSAVSENQRTARFVCASAIASADGKIVHTAEGRCEGRIIFQPRGSNGFGYDPVFIPEGYDRTLAELSAEVKNRISHRARALAAAREFLMGWRW